MHSAPHTEDDLVTRLRGVLDAAGGHDDETRMICLAQVAGEIAAREPRPLMRRHMLDALHFLAGQKAEKTAPAPSLRAALAEEALS